MLDGSGEVVADGVAVPCCGSGAEAAGDLLLGFAGAQAAFGLVGGGRDAQVGEEAQTDTVRLGAETKQITHPIRMAAYNAETTLALALYGHLDEAYALIREALTTSGDICPGPGQLLIRLDPLTAPPRTQAMTALCERAAPGVDDHAVHSSE